MAGAPGSGEAGAKSEAEDSGAAPSPETVFSSSAVSGMDSCGKGWLEAWNRLYRTERGEDDTPCDDGEGAVEEEEEEEVEVEVEAEGG